MPNDTPHCRRLAVSPRRNLGRKGREFRAVFRERDKGRTVSVRRNGREGTGTHRTARIHRRSLARLRAGRSNRARSTATACTARTSRKPGHRFNPNKLLLDPYAKAHVGELKWDPAVFGYTLDADGDDLTFDERDSAPFMQKCQVVDPDLHLDARDARSRAVGPHDLLRNARARLHEAPSGGAGAHARHVRGPRAEGGHRAHQEPRRDVGRTDADPRVRQRQLSARQGPHATTGATTRSASSPPIRAISRAARASSPSSRRWSTGCTKPASK